jgi:hypothetical protein
MPVIIQQILLYIGPEEIIYRSTDIISNKIYLFRVIGKYGE